MERPPPHAYGFIELIGKQPSYQKQYTESMKPPGNLKGIPHRHKKQNPKETQKTPESHKILKKKELFWRNHQIRFQDIFQSRVLKSARYSSFERREENIRFKNSFKRQADNMLNIQKP